MSKFGKYFLLATGFALLVTFARIPRAVTKVHAQDRGCSVASLKGTYAYRRTGVNNGVGGPIAEIGIDVFNGDGMRGIIRSTRSTNGEIQDWTDFPWPSGSYTVDPDCTGSFSQRMVRNKTTSSSLTEARDSPCAACCRTRLSPQRG